MTASSSPTGRIDEAKRDLRDRMVRIRRGAHRQAGRDAAAALLDNFQSARQQGLVLNAGDTVSGYWPLRDEIDIRALLTALHGEGTVCGLPVVMKRAVPLVFRRWRPGEELESAAFGLSQPSSDAPVIEPRVLLVPLLAVDSAGNRLGYGAGYYDRTLQALRAQGPATAVGIAFEAQRVAALPVDGYDQPLDWLVTERSVTRFGR